MITAFVCSIKLSALKFLAKNSRRSLTLRDLLESAPNKKYQVDSSRPSNRLNPPMERGCFNYPHPCGRVWERRGVYGLIGSLWAPIHLIPSDKFIREYLNETKCLRRDVNGDPGYYWKSFKFVKPMY